MSTSIRILARSVAALFFVVGTAFADCTNPITVNPSSINFGNVGIGLGLYGAVGSEFINSCNKSVEVNSITFSSPVFGLADGVLPRYVSANSNDNWSFAFRPALAQVYSGTMTLNLSGYPPVVVNLTGTGLASKGKASLSTTSINFGNVPLGTTVSQNVTLTNTGTGSFSITQLNTFAPFQVPTLTKAVTLGANKTYTFPITYTATTLGAVMGAATLVYNFLPAEDVDIAATAVAPTGVVLTSFPVLPAGTQGSPYLATLQAAGGLAPYSFSLSKGTISGLTFTPSTGTFGGTIASSVAVGSHSLTVTVYDSSKPAKRGTANITIPVGAPTGANCSVIDFDVPNSTTPMTALNDLGTGTYSPFGAGCPEPEGCEGGLYPGGSNTDPAPHASDGITWAQKIQPLDTNGNPSASGAIVLLALGESATQQPFNDFMNVANGDPARNPKVVIINGALGDETATGLCSPSAGYLSTVLNYVIPFYGPYSANQVQAVWLDTVNSGDTAGFPTDATDMLADFESGNGSGCNSILANLVSSFPHLQIAYLGATNYTGYAEGVSTVLPEPQSYDESWADKWMIEDQINGTCCNYNLANGTVTSPWLAWGYYYWANGLLARKDGTYWSCQDLSSDGIHPLYPVGHYRIASGLLNFLKTDPTATPWFVAPGLQ
ncbi:MAG TPA: choice-of-anchor D domain-containing protein [Terriglobia bacterium]|nr:choice-of-anchor D domain-containing protein [Terriglobia bacterium]